MLSIRKGTCRDASRISELLIKKYLFPSVVNARLAYRNECRYQHYRIAKQNNRIVGCVSWRLQGIPEHGVAELTRIVIDPAAKNPEEIKELLFDQCVAEADYYYAQHHSRLRKIFSLIHSDDREIKQFFLRKGMLEEATLHNHFRPGKDELVLSLFFA